jgi:hypothetical protein
MVKPRLLLVAPVALAALAAAPGAAAATVPTAAAACATRVDIGVTVFDSVHGLIRGSGSYTSRSCLAISSVYLIIEQRHWLPGSYAGVARTKVTRYPSEPSSAKFSPKDYGCRFSDQTIYYRTKISWKYSSGGGGTKYSNAIGAKCL